MDAAGWKRKAFAWAGAMALAAAPALADGGVLDALIDGLREDRHPTAAGVLRNGQSVTGLTGRGGTRTLHRIYLPAGQAELAVSTSGGRGDVDLYVQHGQPPTKDGYVARSAGSDTDERILVRSPQAGWWFVMTHAFGDYRGVTLSVRYAPGGAGGRPGHDGPGGIRHLAPGESVRDLAGRSGSRHWFRIDVPAGLRHLVLTTSGGAGDADLYLSRASVPEPKEYQYASQSSDSRERIAVVSPRAGTWYALVYGYRPYRGLTLQVAAGGAQRPPHGPRGRWIRIQTPTAGSTLVAGRSYAVRWTASPFVRAVRVLYSIDGGDTWKALADRVATAGGSGSLTWTVPQMRRRTRSVVQLRAVDAHNPQVADETGRILVVRQGTPAPRPRPRPRPGRRTFEPNNTERQATRLEVDTTQTHRMEEDDVDWLIFYTPTPGTYRLEFKDVEVDLEVRVYAGVHGRDRENVIRTFDVDGSYRMDVDTVPANHYFKVRVEAEDNDDDGTYDVSLRRVAGRRPPVPRPGHRHRKDD